MLLAGAEVMKAITIYPYEKKILVGIFLLYYQFKNNTYICALKL